MKKFISLLSVFLFISLSSCEIKLEKYMSYLNEDKYEILGEDGFTFTDKIENINLDWVKGTIKIVKRSEEGVFIDETIKGEQKEDYITRFWLDGTTLNIKYCKSNTSMPTSVRKSITLYVNENINLDEFELNNVSSNIEINGIKSDNIEINNVSGNVEITKAETKEIEYNGVSGNFTCMLTQLTSEVEINQVSGNSIVSLPSTTAGFKVSFNSVSGKIDYEDFPNAAKYTNDVVYLDGKYLIVNANTTSGNISISKYNSEEPVIER